ncbi:hypothetical protein AB0F17_34170 [Nonomuraea sp. NPDC026600]|uniref:hypothetical protein n=1 Tax=Nonomuraea sp. NPDC026600 TaxID=3155363 RepID=UPI0033ECEDFA
MYAPLTFQGHTAATSHGIALLEEAATRCLQSTIPDRLAHAERLQKALTTPTWTPTFRETIDLLVDAVSGAELEGNTGVRRYSSPETLRHLVEIARP